ncbi:MAG: hypothetical protein V4542_20645 [Pseudomonadota bacterium]
MTFSLSGLTAHDETLFKSFVRLLAHRTLQQWTFTPEKADVHVVTQEALKSLLPGQKALVVGHAHNGEKNFVGMPFHADALEHVLNDLGSSVASEKQAGTPGFAADMPPARFRLLRWPPSGMLSSTDRMRLATMMTGKWTSLVALHERSGVPLAVCSQFMADLQHAGLLLDFTQTPQATPTQGQQDTAGARSVTVTAPRNVEPGLISRIRSRLGIFSSGRT